MTHGDREDSTQQALLVSSYGFVELQKIFE